MFSLAACGTLIASTTCAWCYDSSTSSGYCQSMYSTCTYPYPYEALVPSECDDYSYYYSAYTAAVWVYIVATVVPFFVIVTIICIIVRTYAFAWPSR